MNNKKTISLDLRQRILATYDEGNFSRNEIARRFKVSLGMVKKLLTFRNKKGNIAARHCYSGRKAIYREVDYAKVRSLVEQKPDSTLEELRLASGLLCTITTIHRMLAAMKFSFKKNATGQRARAQRHRPSMQKMAATSAPFRPGKTGFSR